MPREPPVTTATFPRAFRDAIKKKLSPKNVVTQAQPARNVSRLRTAGPRSRNDRIKPARADPAPNQVRDAIELQLGNDPVGSLRRLQSNRQGPRLWQSVPFPLSRAPDDGGY